MSEIYERSATRVDLAGGTLDCWPIYLFLREPVVVSVAIDVFTHCWLQPRPGPEIEFWADDLGARKSYSGQAEALADNEPAFALARAHLAYWRPATGFLLRTKSESPVGGGLGGSSSLCVSMIKAFSKWLGRSLEPHKAALVASHLEAQVLRKPTGTQDYFPSLLNGLCFISYGVEGPRALGRPLPRGLFEDRFALAYTGRSHHSGINNWQVIKSVLDGDPKPMRALEALAEVASSMRAAFEASAWDRLPELFDREFEARVRLSEGFSSPEIVRLKELAKDLGANAKICGAGGGGCVMIWCPDRQAAAVREACAREGFQALLARPWEPVA
jgi:D-glycero-alpha-D-manno-heptose-7-phosphate kinase